jgi:Tfp pilus assembly protein PilX
MNRLRPLREQSGSALITAVMILMIIMMLGAVVLDAADVQTHQTGHERAGEMAFSLAESSLDAEASLLESNWPTSSASAYPVCTQNSTASSTCPVGSITAGYNTTYAGAGFGSPTWSTQVIDDNVTGVADPNYYSDAILNSTQLQHYDYNADNKLWIRASATIGGQTRTAVAEIGRQSQVIKLPETVVTSGGIVTTNNGNKVIIEAKDPNSGLTGSVSLRCSGTPSYGSSCAGWDPTQGQLDPAGAYQTSYTDPSGNYQTLSGATIDALRQTAEMNGTYYPAGQCPPLGQAGVLFIENANCSYTGSGTTNWNSDSAPGAIVVATGTLTFSANINFYGILYLANGQGTVPASGACTSAQQNTVFTVQGGGSIHGGIFVDKCGVVNAGDAQYDIIYDTAAFGGFKSYATPSLAQNTFRIISN